MKEALHQLLQVEEIHLITGRDRIRRHLYIRPQNSALGLLFDQVKESTGGIAKSVQENILKVFSLSVPYCA